MMQKRIFLMAAMLAPCLSTNAVADLLEPASLQFGATEFEPQILLRRQNDDNLYRQSTLPEAFWVDIMAVQMKAKTVVGLDEYSVNYRTEGAIVESRAEDDYVDHDFSLRGFWTPDVRHRIETVGSYSRNHDRRGTRYFQGEEALIIDAPARYEEERLLGRYSYGAKDASGRLDFEVQGTDRTYLNFRELTEQNDRTEVYGTGTFLWRVAGNLRALIEATLGDVNYVNDPIDIDRAGDRLDSTYTTGMAGVTWDIAGKTTGTLKAGQTVKQFEDGDREDFSGASWVGEVKWLPVGRHADESEGRGDFIDVMEAGARWRHAWSDRVESRVHYAQSEETYEGDPEGRDDDIYRYGLNLDYALRRWCVLGAFYLRDERKSSLAQYEYPRNLSGVSLRLSL
jgi:hypothetical protein